MKKLLSAVLLTALTIGCGESVCDADTEMCQVRVSYDNECSILVSNRLRYVVSGGCVLDENLRAKDPKQTGGTASFQVGTGHEYFFSVGRASSEEDEEIASLRVDIPTGCTDTAIVLLCN